MWGCGRGSDGGVHGRVDTVRVEQRRKRNVFERRTVGEQQQRRKLRLGVERRRIVVGLLGIVGIVGIVGRRRRERRRLLEGLRELQDGDAVQRVRWIRRRENAEERL